MNHGGSPWRHRGSPCSPGGSFWALDIHKRPWRLILDLGGSPWAMHGGSSWTWRLTLEPWRLIMERGGSPSYFRGSPWSECSSLRVEAHPQTLEVRPGVNAHHGGWRLTLEPWRPTLDWMFIMERGGSPSYLGGSPWSECSSLRVEAHPQTLEAHPGVDVHHGGWRLTLEPWRLTLEWMFIMERGGSISNPGGSPWSGGSS